MTFIASVIAKDGVAVIADSLVSTVERVLNARKWYEFIQSKKEKNKPGEDFRFTPEEITDLFERKPSYTKDYETKLFEYDKHTLITTSGAALINEKRIIKLVAQIKKKNQIGNYQSRPIDKKVKEFCNCLITEIKEHLGKIGSISTTTFIISHFNKSTGLPHIFKITVKPNNKKSVQVENPEYILCEKQEHSVVCDGQNGIADRILFGGILDAMTWLDNILKSMKKELEEKGVKEGEEELLPNNFFKDFNKAKAREIINEQGSEAQLFQLSNLSLQQASDLAYLLLMVERDFQAYTKDIPTVGGVIKLATITEGGVNFILGKNIIKPTRHL